MRIHSRIRLLSTIALFVLPLTGCSHEGTIPASAKIVRSGEGRFGYIAEENGNVYVRDTNTRERIAAAQVVRGDMVFVESATNDIQVKGKPIDHKIPLDGSHSYEIYFDRAVSP